MRRPADRSPARSRRVPVGAAARSTLESPVVAVTLMPAPAVQAAWWVAPALRAAPLVIASPDGRIVAACPRAMAAGVLPGQTLAQARLRCPQLRALPPDGATTDMLWQVALRALADVSPVIEAADVARGVIYLDARGLDPLIGDPAAVARAAIVALYGRGIAAHAGAGPGRVSALALAVRQGEWGSLALAGTEARDFLHSLPIDDPALGIDSVVLNDLREVGVATAGILASLPEASLAIRFGPTAARAWRSITGDEPPLRPWAAPPSWTVARRLDGVVDDAAIVAAALTHLAGDLSARLVADGHAAATLVVRLECDDGVRHVQATYHEPPLQGASAIAARARDMWGRLTPRAPVEEIALDALDLVAPYAVQAGLWDADGGALRARRQERLAGVLGAHTRRYGVGRVRRVARDPRAPDGWRWEEYGP